MKRYGLHKPAIMMEDSEGQWYRKQDVDLCIKLMADEIRFQRWRNSGKEAQETREEVVEEFNTIVELCGD